MSKSMFVELEEGHEYELKCTHYSPGSPQTYDDMGDGPEAEIGSQVRKYIDGKSDDAGTYISFNEFVSLYASHNSLSAKDASEQIETNFVNDICQQYANDYDDVERDDGWRDE